MVVWASNVRMKIDRKCLVSFIVLLARRRNRSRFALSSTHTRDHLIYTLKPPAIAPFQSKLSLNQEPRETLWLIIKWVKLQQLFLGKAFYMLTNAPKSFFTFDLLPQAIHSFSLSPLSLATSLLSCARRKFSIVFFFCWISSALNERYLNDRNRIVYSRAIFILLRISMFTHDFPQPWFFFCF